MGPRHCMGSPSPAAVEIGDLEVPGFSFSAAYFTLTLANQLCGGTRGEGAGSRRRHVKASLAMHCVGHHLQQKKAT